MEMTPPDRPSRAPQVAVAVLALVTVGGLLVILLRDGDADEGGAYADAFEDTLRRGEGPQALTDDEADCLAGAMVEAYGLGDLQDEVTPDEIRADPAGWAAGTGLDEGAGFVGRLHLEASGCMDVGEVLNRRLAETQGQEHADCFTDRLEDPVREALLGQEVGVEITDPEVLDDLATISLECGSLGG